MTFCLGFRSSESFFISTSLIRRQSRVFSICSSQERGRGQRKRETERKKRARERQRERQKWERGKKRQGKELLSPRAIKGGREQSGKNKGNVFSLLQNTGGCGKRDGSVFVCVYLWFDVVISALDDARDDLNQGQRGFSHLILLQKFLHRITTHFTHLQCTRIHACTHTYTHTKIVSQIIQLSL